MAYNEWANERILACVDDLTAQQFTKSLVSSFSTIRDTLVHIVVTEWVWLQRWKGQSPRSAPDWTQHAMLENIRSALREVEAQRRKYLRTIDDEDLNRSIGFVYLSGAEGRHTLEEMLLHVVNHSTYHRGQVVTLLRQVGAIPISTDMVTFYTEARKTPNAV